MLPVIVSTTILLGLLLGGSYSYGRFKDQVSKFVPIELLNLVMVVLILVIGLIAVLSYWIYSQNRLILTNTHLVQVSRQGIFSTSVIRFNLEDIQDVRNSKRGVVASLLNYGDVMIDTAGQELNMVFYQVSNPNEVAEKIIQTAHLQKTLTD